MKTSEAWVMISLLKEVPNLRRVDSASAWRVWMSREE